MGYLAVSYSWYHWLFSCLFLLATCIIQFSLYPGTMSKPLSMIVALTADLEPWEGMSSDSSMGVTSVQDLEII